MHRKKLILIFGLWPAFWKFSALCAIVKDILAPLNPFAMPTYFSLFATVYIAFMDVFFIQYTVEYYNDFYLLVVKYLYFEISETTKIQFSKNKFRLMKKASYVCRLKMFLSIALARSFYNIFHEIALLKGWAMSRPL